MKSCAMCRRCALCRLEVKEVLLSGEREWICQACWKGRYFHAQEEISRGAYTKSSECHAAVLAERKRILAAIMECLEPLLRREFNNAPLVDDFDTTLAIVCLQRVHSCISSAGMTLKDCIESLEEKMTEYEVQPNHQLSKE